MGLITDTNKSYSTFLSIYGGSIVREWRKEEPSADQIPDGLEVKTREISKGDNVGKTVWYVEYPGVSGMVDNIKLDTEGKYGDRLMFTLKDVDETFELNIPVNSSYGTHFLMKMNNLDVSKEVVFKPYDGFTTPDGKDIRAGLSLQQDGEKVASFYTKDEPKGLPELVVKKVGSQTRYNSDDRDAFLYQELEKFIKKVGQERDKHSATNVKSMDVKDPVEVSDTEDEDLPF